MLNPFGSPQITATPLVTELSLRGCQSPLALLQELRRSSEPRGATLLETADRGMRETACCRSIVITRPLLRLELREGRFAVTALAAGMEEVSAELQRKLRAPSPRADESVSDRERILQPTFLDGLRATAGLLADNRPTPVAPGIFGAIAYEAVDAFETLPPRKPDPAGDPDVSFVLSGDVVIFDELRGSASVVTRGLPWESARGARERHEACLALLRDPAPEPSLPSAGSRAAVSSTNDVSEAEFKDRVSAFRDRIMAGDIFQGVLSRSFEVASDADPLAVYAALRQTNPSPHMFFMELSDGELLGASPETFLRVENGIVEVNPIAGTVPRGRRTDGALDEDLDNRLALSLLLDRKEQAEHAMLLDLARNDLARVSDPGSVSVVRQFDVEKYSHVQHLVSCVRGKLRSGLDALHAYRAVANMGTLTGAPKIRAMELIRETESTGRGFYGGAAGYLLQDGTLDTCIIIRTLRRKAGTYFTRAGAGIVWDSRPEAEFAEVGHKARACLEAIASAAGRCP